MLIRKRYLGVLIFGSSLVSFLLGFAVKTISLDYLSPGTILSPFVHQEQKKLPLLKYSISNLKSYKFQSSPIKIEKILETEAAYTSYLFSYTTMGKRMTGQLNVPNVSIPNQKIIIMLRGYVPSEAYTTGVGTRNAAAEFVKNGYITLAPDFFGFGESQPEPEDSWESRFVKPINVIELIKSIEDGNYAVEPQLNEQIETALRLGLQNLSQARKSDNNIGIWAHSNGGQIALTVLEVLSEPIPTTLWAPVTAPFPYSVLFYSDESPDEGKVLRSWVSIFEQDYDAHQFSITKHLDKLIGPIQIQHGQTDESALLSWTLEFIEKIDQENDRRNQLKNQPEGDLATISAKLDSNDRNLDPINIKFFEYPNTDHNLKPNWDTAVQRDLEFFENYL